MPTPHVNPTGLLDLLSETGPMAKIVLLILLSVSVACWTIIFTKWKSLKMALQQNDSFIQTFWDGKNIDEILGQCGNFQQSPVASIFKNGVKEMRKFSNSAPSATGKAEQIDNIYRALNRASTTEISTLEKHVGWLATTASAAPFIGLFGTVWGIMNSFQNIGATGAANLAVVAPGISEALITTAMGIGAAIPAVVAYNYFVGQIKKISIDLECFSQDFINIIQRSLSTSGRKGE